ncbi:unnamed protein product [Schistocephalus solidus]|uniref:Uncharacterized protein n=1 Tax=Schistocephalus solidus TaxID=70667 RepID=A0A183TPY0_SCHSO|nr:unnamed protein product [Schistocephalus solidus]
MSDHDVSSLPYEVSVKTFKKTRSPMEWKSGVRHEPAPTRANVRPTVCATAIAGDSCSTVDGETPSSGSLGGSLDTSSTSAVSKPKLAPLGLLSANVQSEPVRLTTASSPTILLASPSIIVPISELMQFDWLGIRERLGPILARLTALLDFQYRNYQECKADRRKSTKRVKQRLSGANTPGLSDEGMMSKQRGAVGSRKQICSFRPAERSLLSVTDRETWISRESVPGEVLLVSRVDLQLLQGLASFGDMVGDIIIDFGATGEAAAQVSYIYQKQARKLNHFHLSCLRKIPKLT